MSAIQKACAAGLGLGGLGLVALQFSGTTMTAAQEQAMPEDVKNSKLKRTLTNGGLYPQPEEGKKNIKRTLSGSMAVFDSNAKATDVVLAKGGGDPM
mmetsp:Transcript_13517/g.22484  ORF Transcript_13517/g.22484 Transcript_13517/m.22484 type:complete len:97 (+) Transcript_13517:62-352(+)|eukprot:CAMPEP_0119298282 /NCGR_PEP_ID=MMETSP1333-20130426/479_1 /TAXON_ID=418940 /ORGANISM="Scyphosphaera apsteinii, Strain RCC1455" /LENGTH=96 /DNA_ID=CAMNT_0007299351 /DNA_START=92 /DNA_END=382 /DNA_ORIENTATION=+